MNSVSFRIPMARDEAIDASMATNAPRFLEEVIGGSVLRCTALTMGRRFQMLSCVKVGFFTTGDVNILFRLQGQGRRRCCRILIDATWTSLQSAKRSFQMALGFGTRNVNAPLNQTTRHTVHSQEIKNTSPCSVCIELPLQHLRDVTLLF